MKFKPLNKKLIIKPIKKEEKKNTLLLLSDNNKYEKFFEIVNISEDCAIDLKIGDKVYIDRYSNHAIEGTDDLFIVREENIIALVE